MGLQIIRDGRNLLIHGVKNGSRIPIRDLGVMDSNDIKRLWTVLNEADLYIGYDTQTGAKITVPLSEAKPKHHQNAFIEDRMHDWWILNGELRYEAHSTEVGETVTILIELTPASA